MSATRLPSWYVSQLPSLNDCGPACATTVLKFLGYDYDIALAKSFDDGVWTFNTFKDFFSERPNVKLSKTLESGVDKLNVVLSSYFLVNHWIVEQNGKYFCPIDGDVKGKKIVNRNLFITAATAAVYKLP